MSTLVPNPQLLTIKETAQLLAISEKSVRRKIAAGQLPALQLGPKRSGIRVPADELEAWLEAPPEAAA